MRSVRGRAFQHARAVGLPTVRPRCQQCPGLADVPLVLRRYGATRGRPRGMREVCNEPLPRTGSRPGMRRVPDRQVSEESRPGLLPQQPGRQVHEESDHARDHHVLGRCRHGHLPEARCAARVSDEDRRAAGRRRVARAARQPHGWRAGREQAAGGIGSAAAAPGKWHHLHHHHHHPGWDRHAGSRTRTRAKQQLWQFWWLWGSSNPSAASGCVLVCRSGAGLQRHGCHDPAGVHRPEPAAP